MTRRIRCLTPNAYYFITQRCSEERFFLEPSPGVNEAARAWLARAQEIFEVEIVAYTFMSNHYHLVARAPKNNLPSFMGYFSANLARSLNRIHNHRGAVWHKRYSAIVLLNDLAIQDRVAYTENNPVSAGLCQESSAWCGASSANQSEPVMELTMVHRRPWHREARMAEGKQAKYTVTHKLTLSSVPGMAIDTPRKVLRKQMHYKNRNPYSRPINPKRGAEPIAFGEMAQIMAYRVMYQSYREAYRMASPSFRDGEWGVEFPIGSYRPPLHDRPCGGMG